MAKSDWDKDYKNPGKAKVSISLFWASNYAKKTTTYKNIIDRAEKMLKEHNIGLDIYPSRTRVASHEIEIGDDPILPDRYNELRLKAAKVFDDQKTQDKRQRLPVIFCQFKDSGFGITVLRGKHSPWLAYTVIGQAVNRDNTTLIHEIGHAASNSSQHSLQKGNFMHESTHPERTIMVKSQIQQIARAYFVA